MAEPSRRSARCGSSPPRCRAGGGPQVSGTACSLSSIVKMRHSLPTMGRSCGSLSARKRTSASPGMAPPRLNRPGDIGPISWRGSSHVTSECLPRGRCVSRLCRWSPRCGRTTVRLCGDDRGGQQGGHRHSGSMSRPVRMTPAGSTVRPESHQPNARSRRPRRRHHRHYQQAGARVQRQELASGNERERVRLAGLETDAEAPLDVLGGFRALWALVAGFRKVMVVPTGAHVCVGAVAWTAVHSRGRGVCGQGPRSDRVTGSPSHSCADRDQQRQVASAAPFRRGRLILARRSRRDGGLARHGEEVLVATLVGIR